MLVRQVQLLGQRPDLFVPLIKLRLLLSTALAPSSGIHQQHAKG